eukprot:COSAG02_NODE_3324_length_6938_cov_3.226641_5_plen_182_part_00
MHSFHNEKGIIPLFIKAISLALQLSASPVAYYMRFCSLYQTLASSECGECVPLVVSCPTRASKRSIWAAGIEPNEARAARCDGTELYRLDRPARHPHPRHRMRTLPNNKCARPLELFPPPSSPAPPSFPHTPPSHAHSRRSVDFNLGTAVCLACIAATNRASSSSRAPARGGAAADAADTY